MSRSSTLRKFLNQVAFVRPNAEKGGRQMAIRPLTAFCVIRLARLAKTLAKLETAVNAISALKLIHSDSMEQTRVSHNARMDTTSQWRAQSAVLAMRLVLLVRARQTRAQSVKIYPFHICSNHEKMKSQFAYHSAPMATLQLAFNAGLAVSHVRPAQDRPLSATHVFRRFSILITESALLVALLAQSCQKQALSAFRVNQDVTSVTIRILSIVLIATPVCTSSRASVCPSVPKDTSSTKKRQHADFQLLTT